MKQFETNLPRFPTRPISNNSPRNLGLTGLTLGWKQLKQLINLLKLELISEQRTDWKVIFLFYKLEYLGSERIIKLPDVFKLVSKRAGYEFIYKTQTTFTY